MKMEKLGKDLVKVKVPFWAWSPEKALVKAVLELQEGGKVITSVRRISAMPLTYLVFTMDKQGGL